MLKAQEQRDEVARLLANISTEYEAAQRSFSGFAQGSSQHDFTMVHMENMGDLHHQLYQLVGDSAIAMAAEQLEHCRE